MFEVPVANPVAPSVWLPALLAVNLLCQNGCQPAPPTPTVAGEPANRAARVGSSGASRRSTAATGQLPEKDEQAAPTSQAVVVDLPPYRLRLLASNSIFRVVPPRAGALLQLSGPPGGPLGITFEPLAADVPLNRSFVTARIRRVEAVGTVETASISGREHPALSVIVGRAASRSHHCLVRLVTEAGARPLLMTITTPATAAPPSCSSALLTTAVEEVLSTLRYEAAPPVTRTAAPCDPLPTAGGQCQGAGLCALNADEYLGCRQGHWVPIREFRGPLPQTSSH
jgi:hypothetical protein